MYSVMLYTAFFLSGTIACSANAIGGVTIPEIQQQMAIGDYSFIARIPDKKLHTITKISPQAPFFIGQYLLDAGDTAKAMRILEEGTKKSRQPYNRLCAFLLLETAPMEHKIEYGEAYCKKWPEDSMAAAYLADAYAAAGKITKAGALAKKFGITDAIFSGPELPSAPLTENNALASLSGHYIAMKLSQDNLQSAPQTIAIFNRYIQYFPVTDEYIAATEKFVHLLPMSPTHDMRITMLTANGRILVAQKRYADAVPVFTSLFRSVRSTLLPDTVLSDAGKAFLYSTTESAEIEDIWLKLRDGYMKFFYCGRLSAKMKKHQEAAAFFKQAADAVPVGKQKDAAIWYALTESATADFDVIPDIIHCYQRELNDAAYFSDFFESYITEAVQKNKWNTLARLYYRFETAADADTTARLAYLTARGLESGLITELPLNIGSQNETATEQIKQIVLDTYTNIYVNEHASFYYRILAGRRLGQKDETAVLFKHTVRPSAAPPVPGTETGTPECLLARDVCIREYLNHGMKNRAYAILFQKDTVLSTDTLFEFSQIYRDRFADYQKSIRIAVAAISTPDRLLSDQELELAYPHYYSQEIAAAAALYNLDLSLLYGLIRTESYFNSDITSYVGAVGLMQLMESTAADIARKLKIKEYSLRDPQTNIAFGTFYLAELIRRLNGAVQDAVFAYNGGISRVRRWHTQISYTDEDLFLECVPIEETRDYGRKVLAAAAVYRYLYYIKAK